MLKLFARNQPYILAIIPLLVVSHLLLNYFFPFYPNSDVAQIGTFFNWNECPVWLNIIWLTGLTSLNAVLINNLFNSHDFWLKNTYLPSLSYLIVIFYFPQSAVINGDILGHTFLILSITFLFQLRQGQDGRKSIFNAAFLAGLACVCSPFLAISIIFVLLAISAIRPFVWREYLLALVGFAIPLFYLVVFQSDVWEQISFTKSEVSYFNYNTAIVFLSSLGIITILFFIAVVGLSKRASTSSIRFKKLRNILIYLLLTMLSLGVFLQLSTFSYKNWVHAAIPFAFILPYAYLVMKKKTVVSLFFYTIIGISVAKFFI